jgi:hypothetical protein
MLTKSMGGLIVNLAIADYADFATADYTDLRDFLSHREHRLHRVSQPDKLPDKVCAANAVCAQDLYLVCRPTLLATLKAFAGWQKTRIERFPKRALRFAACLIYER